MVNPTPAVMELLFVRHSDTKKRSSLYGVSKLITRPFDDYGSTGVGSEGDTTVTLPNRYASDACELLVGRFPDQVWNSVFSDSATIDEILAANETVGRLQFARLTFNESGETVSIGIFSGAKVLGRYELKPDGKSANVSGPKDLKSAIEGIHEVPPMLDAFRQHFQLTPCLKTVIEDESGYRVIDETTAEQSPQVCQLLLLHGRNSPKKGTVRAPSIKQLVDREHTVKKYDLGAALMRLDQAEVQLAIQQGADVNNIPGAKFSPLQDVLLRMGSPGAPECAKLLIQAGAKTGDLIAYFCESIYMEAAALLRVQFLVENGGDVNVPHRGFPPIYLAASREHPAVVKLLMQHGADPSTIVPEINLSTIQWTENRFLGTTDPHDKKVFAAILTELKGELVPLPEKVPLSETLLAEKQRFLVANQAMALLNNLPAKLPVVACDENKLHDKSRFQSLHAALLSAGFQPAGFYIDKNVVPIFTAGYSNESLHMDAAITDRWWTKEVGCRVMAYGESGDVYSVCDYRTKTDPHFDPKYLKMMDATGSTVKQMIDGLTEWVSHQETALLPTPIDEFAERFQANNHRQLKETRRLIEQKLQQEAIRNAQGEPVRFERRRQFLDFSGFSDPERSSRHMSEEWRHSVATSTLHRFNSCRDVIQDSFNLLAMQRMEYAGAEPNQEYLRSGIAAGVEFFQKLRTDWVEKQKAELVSELGMVILYCLLVDDSRSLTTICDNVDPGMLHRERNPNAPILELGVAVLEIVSHFRSVPLPELPDMKANILQAPTRKAKAHIERAQAIFEACECWEKRDATGMQKALLKSVKLFKKIDDPVPGAHYLLTKFAVVESVLYLAGKADSLIDRFSDEIEDWMIIK